MTVLRTNDPIYFNAVNLFKCQFSKDPLKVLMDEMVSSFQQGRIPDNEYFIFQIEEPYQFVFLRTHAAGIWIY